MAIVLAGCIPSIDYGEPLPPAPPAERQDPPRRAEPSPPAQSVAPAAEPPPAWEARPVTADARAVAASSYTVRPGDTLRAIADATGAGSEAIARANGLSPPFTIRAGEQLSIPGGRYHLVRAGETGIAIARAYGVGWSDIVALNDLAEPYILRTGMRLLLPSGGEVARMSAAERAAAFRLDIDDILTGGEPAIAETAAPVRPAPAPARTAAAAAPPPRPRPLPATTAIAAPAALSGGFDWPARGPILKRFGPGASGERNEGVKIGLATGTPVKASADGVVVYVGDSVPALGGLVLVRHGEGWTTAYGHMGRIAVTRGQSVRRGQELGRSGDTGFADRPQLHFEMRKGRSPVDPLRQLPR